MSASLPLGTRHDPDGPGKAPNWPHVVFNVGCVSYGILVVAAIGSGRFELIDPVVQLPVMFLIARFVARRIARADDDPNMEPFVIAAFTAKMLGALARYLLGYALYNGQVDASDYQAYGRQLAPLYRSLNFSVGVGGGTGTSFMRGLTGVIYAFSGSSRLGGYFVFSFLSFLGFVLLWRAFKRAIPNGDSRTYSLLILFLPSFLYWPSAIGKEAWAIFTIGIASYGVARIMTHSLARGVALFALGLLGITVLRPHISLTMFCGLFLAAAVAKSRRKLGTAAVTRGLVFGVLLVLGLVLVSQAKAFFGVPALNQETINKTLTDAAGQTSEGGSSFAPVRFNPGNPVSWVGATVTVLVRPLPYEAHNVEALVASAEGAFIVVMTIARRKRLRSLWRQMRYHPYTAYCVGVTFTFIFAFSAFSNFGILARERTQVMPFYLALLCLPVWVPKDFDDSQRGAETAPDAEPDPSSPYQQGLKQAYAPPEDPYARFQDGADRGSPPDHA